MPGFSHTAPPEWQPAAATKAAPPKKIFSALVIPHYRLLKLAPSFLLKAPCGPFSPLAKDATFAPPAIFGTLQIGKPAARSTLASGS